MYWSALDGSAGAEDGAVGGGAGGVADADADGLGLGVGWANAGADCPSAKTQHDVEAMKRRHLDKLIPP
ncbi:MAG TPA: hypothetical protein PKA58_12820 [Polyangium sp.]|nr:hypothetical protein [Polyangium sp.]